jgi:amidase
LRSRELSAREVLAAHLAQIEAINPSVNAVVTLVAEQAMVEAAAADERLARGEEVGSLHGLPVAHKDTHRTAGIRTTFGSPIHADLVPDADELIVERMRAAGAITIGKTNVPEFAAGSHTFNPIFGATGNPYDLSKSAGGSSGGAAAALACGMHPIADGSDMGGSLRNPASFCNVVGLRPSAGRVPSHPVANSWATLSVEGAMARSAADLALVLGAISGPDPRSPISLDGSPAQFAAPIERELTGLRVGFSADLGGLLPVEAEVAAAVAAAAGALSGLGADVTEDCPDFAGADEVFRVLRAHQFELAYGQLLDEYPDLLKETIVWNIEQGRGLTGPEVGRAERHRSTLYQRVIAFFEQYDLLVLPTSQVLPFAIELEFPSEIAGVEMTSYLDWMASCYFISLTGLPACSVPAAFSSGGLPIGVQLVGPPRADFFVLQAAHAFEQVDAMGRRRPPVVAPSAPGRP